VDHDFTNQDLLPPFLNGAVSDILSNDAATARLFHLVPVVITGGQNEKIARSPRSTDARCNAG
jgi:hypothetical protein